MIDNFFMMLLVFSSIDKSKLHGLAGLSIPLFEGLGRNGVQ